MQEHAVQPPTPPSLAREARRRLLNTGDLPPELVNPDLARSWMRSLGAGLHPSGRMPGAPHASGPQLARALERQHELVSHARPVMEFMFDQTRCLDSMVILAGADGMLLHAFGDPQFIGRAERVALRPGANWQEQYRGTNAVGTALAEDRAVVIHGGEHYLERNGFLTCTAAPIHDPSGRLLGVLDASGDHRSYHPQMLGAVRSAARMIETRLFESRHDLHLWSGMRLRFHVQPEGIFTVAEGLLAVREDGLVVGANQTALELLGLRWMDLGQIGIDEVLTESVAQLLEWCHRGSPLARVVHTQAERALWMRAEMPRGASSVVMLPPMAASPAIDRSQPDDALAALDTGDAAMTTAITRARKVMGKSIALLLQGESGVGKEVFSRAMHKSSPRGDGPFVSVNCAALPENLIETELFGYQAGAFTGARRDGATGRVREAHGGTLFLDEIGDMPLMLQARLLQVLQDRQVVPIGGGKPVPVDFSLICATHRNIPAEIEAGRFREDLYYRINGFMLMLPPLRERSDLPGLIASELHKLTPVRTPTVDPALLPDLLRYRWPGNVRQLANVLRTACAMLDEHENVIGWQHLPDDLVRALRTPPVPAGPAAPVVAAAEPAQSPAAAPTNLRSVSRQLIERTLADCGGNVSEAGRRLGISRNTLYRRLRETG